MAHGTRADRAGPDGPMWVRRPRSTPVSTDRLKRVAWTAGGHAHEIEHILLFEAERGRSEVCRCTAQ